MCGGIQLVSYPRAPPNRRSSMSASQGAHHPPKSRDGAGRRPPSLRAWKRIDAGRQPEPAVRYGAYQRRLPVRDRGHRRARVHVRAQRRDTRSAHSRAESWTRRSSIGWASSPRRHTTAVSCRCTPSPIAVLSPASLTRVRGGADQARHRRAAQHVQDHGRMTLALRRRRREIGERTRRPGQP